MSWFTELTSKAEAMLVKLDNDAAQALQKDRLLNGVQNAFSGLQSSLDIGSGEEEEDNSFTSISQRPSSVVIGERPEDNSVQKNGDRAIHQDIMNEVPREANNLFSEKHSQVVDPNEYLHSDVQRIQSTSNGSSDHVTTASIMNRNTNDSNSSHVKRKFALQSSGRERDRLLSPKPPNFGLTKSEIVKKTSDNRPTRKRDYVEDRLDASDIRASINQSLQEYASQALQQVQGPTTSLAHDRDHVPDESISYYDDQPNLANQSHLYSPDETPNSSRNLSTSNSFNIDFPDDARYGSQSASEDASIKVLRHKDLRKKSTFHLHTVINRLANSDGTAGPILSDEMKIKLRRAQLRAASYARRLNYYFRTHPMMKYVIVACLILMQLLVVYVLFFYQSNSSMSDFASQVKQQESTIHKSNSEMNPP